MTSKVTESQFPFIHVKTTWSLKIADLPSSSFRHLSQWKKLHKWLQKKLQIRITIFPTHFKQATHIIQGVKERRDLQCAHFSNHHDVGISAICKTVICRPLGVGLLWGFFIFLLDSVGFGFYMEELEEGVGGEGRNKKGGREGIKERGEREGERQGKRKGKARQSWFQGMSCLKQCLLFLTGNTLQQLKGSCNRRFK